jgi:sec-independent protein translocase protein TatA
MGAFQPLHLAFVALIALLVFGPKKLPELAKGIGEAMKEFKRTMHSIDEPEPAAPVVAQVAATPEATPTVTSTPAAPPIEATPQTKS